MKPIYQHIEFCSDPETLWGKIQSGIWDWLGVKADGRTFVLGRPKRTGGSGFEAALTVGAPEGQHGVRVHAPLGPSPSARWVKTEQEAKEEFVRQVESLKAEAEGPVLFKVDRVALGEVVEEEFVVLRPPTYG